jgi:hypothetical protein
MPIESGALCQHCRDEHGQLVPFDETFERFVQWTARQAPELNRAQAESKTLEFMASMPAWSSNTQLAARRAGGKKAR